MNAILVDELYQHNHSGNHDRAAARLRQVIFVFLWVLTLAACRAAPPTPSAPIPIMVSSATSLPTATPVPSPSPTSSPAPAATTSPPFAPRPSYSAGAAQNWRSYAVPAYGFDFLLPRGDEWQVVEIDPHHLQVRHPQAVLTIGYRKAGETIDLPPNSAGKATPQSLGSIDFLGQQIPSKLLRTAVQKVTAYWYDGGAEQERQGRFFTLRLEPVGGAQTLELAPGVERTFQYIVASFDNLPLPTSQPTSATVNPAALGLTQTFSLEIGVFNPLLSDTRYLSTHLINNPKLLGRLVAALDRDLPLAPAPDGVPPYELTFNLADGQKRIFRYTEGPDVWGLESSSAAGSPAAYSGLAQTPIEFDALLKPELDQAEFLRDKNGLPRWVSRIQAQQQAVGPFTLEEYLVLDPGRFQPGWLEFANLIPGWVFQKNYDLRHARSQPDLLHERVINGHSYTADEAWDPATSQYSAIVRRDGLEIYRTAINNMYAAPQVQGFWVWKDQWVLEVLDRIIIDGQELNDRLGAQASFDWQMMDDRPFALLLKDGQVQAWYDGKIYPLGYDQVMHNTCCGASMYDVGHNQYIFTLYALKEGIWRYVELVLTGARPPNP